MTADAGVSLAQVLGEVARSLASAQGLDDTLAAITSGAVDTVPGVEFAGITLVRDKAHIESVGATADLVVQADKAQEEFNEGPCLSALWEHKTFRIDDMTEESRWPRFSARAVELGVRSQLAFQLFTDQRNLGALNLDSGEKRAFVDHEAEQVGMLFATHAAVALRGAQQESQFKTALDSRDVIGMAKGILIERYKVQPDRAFATLVRASQTGHVKLHAVAELLVRSGQAGEPAASWAASAD
jgi:GAF domain-containing protein